MSQKIVVTVKEDGTVEVKTQGFKGKACMKSSQFIEEALEDCEPQKDRGVLLRRVDRKG